MADELRELLQRETAAQVQKIDDELRAMGATPDEFDDSVAVTASHLVRPVRR